MSDKDDSNEWLAKAMQGDSAEAARVARVSAMPLVMEHAKTMAAVRRAYYDAHIEKGFTPEQALLLCIKPFGDGK